MAKGREEARTIPHFLAARLRIGKMLFTEVGKTTAGRAQDRFQREERLQFLTCSLDEHIKSLLQL